MHSTAIPERPQGHRWCDGFADRRHQANGNLTDTTFDANSDLEVAGLYGTLTIKASGDYVYTRNANTPGGAHDVFTYTLKDGDGDTSTATLDITLGNANPAAGASVTLDDDDANANGLLGGPNDLAPVPPSGPLPIRWRAIRR